MVMTSMVAGRHAEPVTEPAEPEVPERASRRTYSAQYKLRILAEYERRDRDGRGALLRREGLYTSPISEWRKQRDQGALQALGAAPGRPAADPHGRDPPTSGGQPVEPGLAATLMATDCLHRSEP
jgi:transposase